MKAWVYIVLILYSLCTYSKSIVVGVIASSPPFAEMSYNGKGAYFYGFSIDIMNNICERLAIQCTYSQVTLNNQLAFLDNNVVDIVLLSIPYDKDIIKNYATSLPYITSSIQFVAVDSSPIKQGDPIKNLRIGVIKSTFYDLLKKSRYNKDNTLVGFNTVAELIFGLVVHSIDVAVINSAISSYYITNDLYKIKAVSPEIPIGEGYGIVALPNNKALIDKINNAILSMQADGSYLAIYKNYSYKH